MYIDKTDLWTADTGCLQESKWNQKCQSCVPNTRHQITGGSPSSPIASVWSQSSLLVNRRWHNREYFPIETNFFGFISFFGGNQVLQGFCIEFSITCNFEGSWEEMPGYLAQELYIHSHTHMYVMYVACGYMLLRTLFWHYALSACIDTFIPGPKQGEDNLCHLKGQYSLCTSSLMCFSS